MDLIGNDISLDDIRSIPKDFEFALESILAEFGENSLHITASPPREPEEPSRPIVMDQEGDIFVSALNTASDPIPAPAVERQTKPMTGPEPLFMAAPDSRDDSDIRIYQIGDILAESASETAFEPAPKTDDDETMRYFSRFLEDMPKAAPDTGGAAENIKAREYPASEPREQRANGAKMASPFVSLLAMIAMRKQMRGSTFATSDANEEDLGPEMKAEGASKYYAGHINSLRLRLRIAIVLSVILMWISFGLPVAGMLKNSPTVMAVMCLILELSVVMLGLDIFTSGMMSLIRVKPTLWSLVSISCFTAALDAVVTAAFGGSVEGLPFCGVAAISMTFAIAGSLQTCRGYRLSLRALALSRDPYAVTAESGVAEDGVTLLKSKRGTAGYLRRCEEPDCAENAYGSAAIFLLGAVLILSVIAAAVSKEWEYFFRILAAITSPCAPFAAFLAFPLPYSIITRRIFQSGSAIAGWAGLRDIGTSKHLIITDRDVFPAGTLSLDSIRILEGTWPEKVISCVGSVICASGSGLAPVFTELMRRNNCSIQRVEEFSCHEGGGLTAMINGEEVLCGNSGFMHLMGIRLPQKLASKNSVFVSINGVLNAIFTIKYVPVTSVQDALASLLHTRREPIFAIRDFNVTPLMIRQKFRMPTDGFDFPTFARRYEISAAEPSPDSQISAIISREGLGALVEVSERGRKSYIAVMLATILSLLCTVVGIFLMFALCLSGSFDSATAGNMLTYMFLWLVPLIVLSFGLGR